MAEDPAAGAAHEEQMQQLRKDMQQLKDNHLQAAP